MTKENFYLKDIERLKKLEPIMDRLGARPDDYWIYAQHPVLPCWVLQSIAKKDDHYFAKEDLATYRSDTLESVLPEWWKSIGLTESGGELKRLLYSFIDKEVGAWAIRNLCREALFSDSQESLEKKADLIILLDEEGLLNGT